MRLADIHQHPQREGIQARMAAYFAALGPGQIITFNELINLCWPDENCDPQNYGPENFSPPIRQHIHRLRFELKAGWQIKSVSGVGYELIAPRREPS